MPTTHIVKQGEWLQKIATDYGFASWKTLYDDPLNEDLRAKRPNPDLLYPGDEVVVPDKVRVDSLDTDGGYRVVLTPRALQRLRLRPLAPDGSTLGDKSYKLVLDGVEHNGTIPSDGTIDEPLPYDATEGTLTVDVSDEQQSTWELQLGNVDPIETLSGLQARLQNLGFYFGELATEDGELDSETEAAVCAFQKAHGVDVDGEFNPETRAKLEQVYGV